MTYVDRFSRMVLKIKLSTIMRYMLEVGVDPVFTKGFACYIDHLLEMGTHPEEIMHFILPPFPPYQRYLFECKEDSDRFCRKIKSWYGLDYVSKQVKEKRWRITHVGDESVSVR